MWIYFLLFFIITFLSGKDLIKVSRFVNKGIEISLVITLILFFGFRYDCDNDYNNYVGIYNATPSLSEGINNVFFFSIVTGVEVGYIFVSSFFKLIEFNVQIIFIFSSFVTFGIVNYVFNKNSLFPTLSLLIYIAQFFALPFVQMRFGVAMAIVLLGCYQLQKGRKAQYWTLILLASSFHFCALGGIVVFLFYRVNWLNKSVTLWAILFVSLFLMVLPMRTFLVNIINSVGIDKYAKLYSDAESASPVSNFISAIILIPLIYYRKQLDRKLIPVNILISMGLSSVLIGSLVWQLGILNRFSMITAIAFCLIIPSYLLLLKTPLDKFVGYILIILFSIIKFLPNMNFVTNYHVFLSH